MTNRLVISFVYAFHVTIKFGFCPKSGRKKKTETQNKTFWEIEKKFNGLCRTVSRLPFFTNFTFILLVIDHMHTLHVGSYIIYGGKFLVTNIAFISFWQMNTQMIFQFSSRFTLSTAFCASKMLRMCRKYSYSPMEIQLQMRFYLNISMFKWY